MQKSIADFNFVNRSWLDFLRRYDIIFLSMQRKRDCAMHLDRSIQKLTDISWIGAINEGGEEEIRFAKTFILEQLPDFAGVRLNSRGVCAVHINGQFIESSCGRYLNRITYAECTSALKVGENTIELQYVGHYFQSAGNKAQERRGGWFSAVAAELELRDGAQIQRI